MRTKAPIHRNDGRVALERKDHHRIGTTALAVYAISRRLAKQPEHANLLPHVELMKRLNRFGVRKRLKKPADPIPTPEPAPSPAPPHST